MHQLGLLSRTSAPDIGRSKLRLQLYGHFFKYHIFMFCKLLEAQAKILTHQEINELWHRSYHWFPEKLNYCYCLVDLSLPHDQKECVKDPTLLAQKRHYSGS